MLLDNNSLHNHRSKITSKPLKTNIFALPDLTLECTLNLLGKCRLLKLGFRYTNFFCDSNLVKGALLALFNFRILLAFLCKVKFFKHANILGFCWLWLRMRFEHNSIQHLTKISVTQTQNYTRNFHNIFLLHSK